MTTDRKRLIIFALSGLVAILLLTAFILSPLLHSGFVSDDALNSFRQGALQEKGMSNVRFAWSFFKRLAISRGSFLPLFPFTDAFLFMSDLRAYKVSILLVVLGSVILYWYLIFIMTNSISYSMLAAAFLPVVFQFRLYHDPILSFGWLMESVTIFTFISLIFLVLYLRHGKRSLLAASLVFFLGSLLTYEVTYPFIIFYFLVAIQSDRKGRSRSMVVPALYALLLACVLTVYWGLRHISVEHSTGTVVGSLSLKVVALSAIKQTSASFPLAYYLADPSRVFVPWRSLAGSVTMQSVGVATVLYAILFLSMYVLGVRNVHTEDMAGSARKGLTLGLYFVVAPVLLVAISKKYQRELAWGVGYIPVYFSWFGSSLILASISSFFLSSASKIRRGFASILIVFTIAGSALAAINYYCNTRVVGILNDEFLYPRSLVEEALHNGLMRDMPQGSSLIVNGNYDLNKVRGGWNFYRWDVPAFYFMHSGIRLKQVVAGERLAGGTRVEHPSAEALRDLSHQAMKQPGIYYLAYSSGSPMSGYAIMGRVERVSWTPGFITEAVSNSIVYLYIRHAEGHKPRMTVEGVQEIFPAAGSPEFKKRFAMPDSAFKLIKSGDKWALFAFRADAVNLASLKVVTFEKNPL